VTLSWKEKYAFSTTSALTSQTEFWSPLTCKGNYSLANILHELYNGKTQTYFTTKYIHRVLGRMVNLFFLYNIIPRLTNLLLWLSSSLQFFEYKLNFCMFAGFVNIDSQITHRNMWMHVNDTLSINSASSPPMVPSSSRQTESQIKYSHGHHVLLLYSTTNPHAQLHTFQGSVSVLHFRTVYVAQESLPEHKFSNPPCCY
jgi:hypothetical protein